MRFHEIFFRDVLLEIFVFVCKKMTGKEKGSNKKYVLLDQYVEDERGIQSPDSH